MALSSLARIYETSLTFALNLFASSCAEKSTSSPHFFSNHRHSYPRSHLHYHLHHPPSRKLWTMGAPIDIIDILNQVTVAVPGAAPLAPILSAVKTLLQRAQVSLIR